MKVAEASDRLKKAGYHIETHGNQLLVRRSANGLPSKLTISWLGTVSDRSVNRMLNRAKNCVVVIEVIERKTGEVVDAIAVNNLAPDRVEKGMLINMDRENFFTRQVLRDKV